ncbi:cupin [Bordetella genomosp. 9]|uniref:Cupin n=1 Tax=Bordetella genomosp. 9 TaxID=1416803 RepID=A0A261R1C0_9BORD|nr:cupin domain-containing protein [Bordetella genomosp. 9]OZI18799.1 cupin [Bordetella genomosp. 9]
MSLLKTIRTADLGEGTISTAAAEILLEGSPTFTTWNQDDAKDGTIRTGVWQATPGTTKSIKGAKFEFCLLLEGAVELTEEGGATVTYRAGDSFVMKPGFIGTWKTIETLRKIYVIVE